MFNGAVENDVLIELVLADGATGQFPQVEIYDDVGALVDTIDLAHAAKGLYQGKFLAVNNTATGEFSLIFIVYSDGAHTVVNEEYDRVADRLQILTELPGLGGGAAV